jgi:hypothetical protein
MEYWFNHRPTMEELKELTKKHLARYEDYCRVWYDDNSSEIFKNTEAVCHTHYKEESVRYRVVFVSPKLAKDGSFGVLGIIRAKRIVKQQPKRV